MKQLLVLLLLMCSISIFAQDVIVKKDGSTVVCKVIEVKTTEIVYKLWSDLNGSNYVMDRSLASSINYENGKKDILAEITGNLYQPNNQSDGYRQANDNALLRMDIGSLKYDPAKRAKKLRTIGWVGGSVLAGGAALIFSLADVWGGDAEYWYAGGACAGAFIIWLPTFLITAHHYQKQANLLYSTTIYQQEFKFNNGSTLKPSIDLFRDQAHNTQTIGLGLQYNF